MECFWHLPASMSIIILAMPFFWSQPSVSSAKSQASFMHSVSWSSQNFCVVPQIMPQAWRCWQHGSTGDSSCPPALNMCMPPPLMASQPPLASSFSGRFGTASLPLGHLNGTHSRARPPEPRMKLVR